MPGAIRVPRALWASTITIRCYSFNANQFSSPSPAFYGSAVSATVRYVIVDDETAGQRLDNFLIRHLKGLPRSRIYRIVRRGEVRVNRGRVRPSYRLKPGDRVRIPPVREASRQARKPSVELTAVLEQRVVYEDDRLLVIDKPSGLAVHGGSGVSHGLIEACRAMRPDCRRLELVHRLDKETSGLVMLAKRASLLRELHRLLRESRVDKRYIGLVRGRWPTGWKTITAPLKKNVLRSGERVVRVDAGGRESATEIRRLGRLRDASLIEARLLTGRTHQIRVHTAAAGFPLAGDRKYGDKEFNRRLKTLGLKRVFLHAASLSFADPLSGEIREFSAPLAPELREVLDALESEARPDRQQRRVR